MNSGKSKSIPGIVIENIVEENVILKTVHDIYGKFYEENKEAAGWIDENGIRWAVLKKKLHKMDIYKNVDYILDEVKDLLDNLKNADNADRILADCGYKCDTLYSFLWKKYCKSKQKDKIIEYESDIMSVLYIIARGWTEAETGKGEFKKKS